MKHNAVLLLLALVLVTGTGASARVILDLDTGSPTLQRGVTSRFQQDGIPYYLYLPASARTDGPTVPLLAIHGFGEDPNAFVRRMIPLVEEHHWLLVAPDLPSGDWRNTGVIRSDARRNLPWLDRLTHNLQDYSPLPLADHVLVYGFSLGAQTGHRFALAYPEHIRAVAVMSAGTYTIPLRDTFKESSLSFPMATTDLDSYSGQPFDFDSLKNTRFWVGVGDRDNVSADVPRDFDGIEGLSRKDRAQSFATILKTQDIPVELHTFPGQAHYETPESMEAAAAFLDRVCQTGK